MSQAGYTPESEQMSAAPEPPTQPYLVKPRNGAGVAALVLGLLGFVLVLLVLPSPLGALLGLLAVIFGIVGIGRAGSGDATNRGQAVTGLIVGLLALALGVLLTVRIGSYLQDHATDVNTLARCLNAASTDQERTACANTFLDQIKPAS
jgi:hypothetical protein